MGISARGIAVRRHCFGCHATPEGALLDRPNYFTESNNHIQCKCQVCELASYFEVSRDWETPDLFYIIFKQH